MWAHLAQDRGGITGRSSSSATLLTTAVRYWAAYPDEVDAEIAAAEAAENSADQSHAGPILVSMKTFPQSRGHPSAVVTALAVLLSGPARIRPGQVLFLTRS